MNSILISTNDYACTKALFDGDVEYDTIKEVMNNGVCQNYLPLCKLVSGEVIDNKGRINVAWYDKNDQLITQERLKMLTFSKVQNAEALGFNSSPKAYSSEKYMRQRLMNSSIEGTDLTDYDIASYAKRFHYVNIGMYVHTDLLTLIRTNDDVRCTAAQGDQVAVAASPPQVKPRGDIVYEFF